MFSLCFGKMSQFPVFSLTEYFWPFSLFSLFSPCSGYPGHSRIDKLSHFNNLLTSCRTKRQCSLPSGSPTMEDEPISLKHYDARATRSSGDLGVTGRVSEMSPFWFLVSSAWFCLVLMIQGRTQGWVLGFRTPPPHPPRPPSPTTPPTHPPHPPPPPVPTHPPLTPKLNNVAHMLANSPHFSTVTRTPPHCNWRKEHPRLYIIAPGFGIITIKYT